MCTENVENKETNGCVKREKYVMEETAPLIPWSGRLRERFCYVGCATVGELSGRWRQNKQACEGKTIKKSTFSNYCYMIKKYIIPHLGTCPLRGLDGEKITGFIVRLREEPLAWSTVNAVLTILRAILNAGVEENLLDGAVLEYCAVRFYQKESRVLNNADSVKMKQYLLDKRDVFSLGILLCRNTGIRVGELCGLKWGDFDFEANTFQVRRTVSRIANPTEGQSPRTVLYIRPPKSLKSIREIPVPGYLAGELRRLRREGDRYFLTGTETCTEPRNVQKRFKTILKRCAMQDCNFHALRHGFATACLDSGTDFKTVSTILGHASVKTTMDIYMHASLMRKQHCIDSIK